MFELIQSNNGARGWWWCELLLKQPDSAICVLRGIASLMLVCIKVVVWF